MSKCWPLCAMSTSSPMKARNSGHTSANGRAFRTSPSVYPCTLVAPGVIKVHGRSEEHTSELQSRSDLVCRLLLEKKKKREMISVTLAKDWSILSALLLL